MLTEGAPDDKVAVGEVDPVRGDGRPPAGLEVVVVLTPTVAVPEIISVGFSETADPAALPVTIALTVVLRDTAGGWEGADGTLLDCEGVGVNPVVAA